MLKIFCIESNLREIYLLRKSITENLKDKFYFDYATDLKEGIKKLSLEKFDIVILDLALRDSLGVITVSKFKSAYPEMPVVVYSADNHQDAIQSAFKAGADVYVSKKDGKPSEVSKVLEFFKTTMR